MKKKEEVIIQQDFLNIKDFISKALDYWYIFLISLVLFPSIAFIYLRYSKPVYSTSSALLIRDKNNKKLGAENLIEGLELFSNSKNLENEIIILGSYSMISKALQKLPFEVSYYSSGDVRTTELYNNSPFQVILDNNHEQVTSSSYNILILSDSTYLIEFTASNFSLYKPITQEVSKNNKLSFNFKKEFKFGEICETPYFKFTILRNTKTIADYILQKEKNLYFSINKHEDLTRAYQSKINISPIDKKSSIIKLQLFGSVIQKDIDFINKLSEEYILSGLEEKNQIATNTINFIDEQLGEVSKSLTGAEMELEKYRKSNQIMNLDFTSANAYEQLTQLDNQKAMLVVKNKYYNYLLDYVTKNNNLNNIVAPSSIGVNDPLLINLIGEINNLYSQKAALNYGVESQNPSISIINNKIKNAKETLIENLNTIINASRIEINDINRRIDDLNVLIKKLPKTERDLVSIHRQFNLNDHIYNYLLEKRAEAGIAKAANTPDNKIIDSAKLDINRPVEPKRSMIYGLAFAIALILPMGIVGILFYFNDKIQGKEALLRLTEIPILGVIGHNSSSSIPLVEHPKSAIAEAFRSIRVNLQYLNTDKKSKIIGITSTISGEGKTFSALNLAIAIGLSNARTLLIGADMRKPRLGNELALKKDIGLSSYLINKNSLNEIIQPSGIENLDIITSGPIPPNPTELLGSKRTKQLFEEIVSLYDYIIIDTPPIGLVSDYFILKEYIDSNLYVVRNNYTEEKALDGINELYRKGDLKNLFIILNDIKPKFHGYGYGYGYGYTYYEEEDKKKNFIGRLFQRS